MPINIGPTLKRRREWARLTQQELVDHTRMDRSASYVGAIERGNTSPTLAELELLARYFRLSVLELLQEAIDDSERRGQETSRGVSVSDEQFERYSQVLTTLTEADQELAFDFLQLLARRRG